MDNEEQTVESAQIPTAPTIDRRLVFFHLQALGVPFLMLVPILGLFRLFDTSSSTLEAQDRGLDLQIRYPARLRYRSFQPLLISVRNDTGKEISTLEIRLERSYVEAFENVNLTPNPEEIDARFVTFQAQNVGVGESRQVLGYFDAAYNGRHSARVETSTELGSGPSASFTTLVLP